MSTSALMGRVEPVSRLEAAFDLLAGWVEAAWAWGQSAWADSLAGRSTRRLQDLAGELWRAGALATWVARLWALVMPPCSLLRWQTWLGIGLGAAVLLPTKAVLLLVFLVAPFWLRDWARGRRQAGQGAASPREQGSGRRKESESWEQGSGRRKAGLSPWLLVSFFALLAAVVGAVPGSVRPRESLVELAFWAGYALAFLGAARAALEGRGEEVAWPVLVLAAAAGAVGLGQYLTGWTAPQSWVDPRFEDEIRRVVGTFTNPTFFAEMMGLALPVTVALGLARRPWRQRLLLAGLAALQAGGMLVSFSRGGWLGLVVSVAALAVLYDRRLLILGLALLLVAPYVLPPVLVERFVSSFSLQDSSNSYRVFIWRGSWALARAYLWTGTGLGADTFTYTYPEYMIIQTPAPHAHSTYLEVLVELGVLGLATLLWFLLAWTGEVWGGVRRFSSTTALGAGILATVAGHLLHGVVEHTWYSPRVTLVFWALLGVAAGTARHSCSRDAGCLAPDGEAAPAGRLAPHSEGAGGSPGTGGDSLVQAGEGEVVAGPAGGQGVC